METNAQIPQNSPSVLLVDDEVHALQSYEMQLLGEGITNCICCLNGEQALEVLEAQDVSLVLLDLRMPGMDGLDVLVQIHAQSPDTPVIIISGAGRIEDVVEALVAVPGIGRWTAEIYVKFALGRADAFAAGDLVLTGDVVMGWSTTLISPPDGDVRDFLASCARLRAREASTASMTLSLLTGTGTEMPRVRWISLALRSSTSSTAPSTGLSGRSMPIRRQSGSMRWQGNRHGPGPYC